jgi:phosphohistidine phosphatase
MKRLLILRHAKAGPHDEKQDKQRDLVERGREDSARMGRAMREKGYVPDLVFCSSAKRTVETWNYAAPALDSDPAVEFLDALYDASETSILKCLRAVKKTAPVLLYIGHNPGLERLAKLLARKPKEPAERRAYAAMAEKFPTAALAVLEFDVGKWADIAPASGTLSDFLTPKALELK